MSMNPSDELAEELPQGPQPATAPPPKRPNPYEKYLRGEPIEDPMTALLRAQRMKAAEQSRDARVKAQQIGQTLGIPPALIDDKDVPRLEKQAQDALVPYRQIAKDSPALAAWLAGEPDAAALARGDIHRLGFFEWWAKMPKKSWDINANYRVIGLLNTESFFRPLTQQEQQTLDWANAQADYANNDLDVGKSWWRGKVAGSVGLFPNLVGGFGSAAKYGAIGAGTAGGLGALGGAAIGGVGAIPGALGAGGYGARAGILYGYAKDAFRVEAGLAYKSYKDFTDEQGRKIDPDEARAAAIVVGGLNAAAEVAELKLLFKMVRLAAPGFADRIAKIGADRAMKEALKNRTTRAALGRAFKAGVGNWAGQSLMEGWQQFVAILGGEYAKTETEGGVTAKQPLEIAKEVGEEIAAAAESMALISAVPGVVVAKRGLREAREAPKVVQFFTAFNEVATASTTIKDAPQAAEKFLKRAAGRTIPAVYAPTDLWREFSKTRASTRMPLPTKSWARQARWRRPKPPGPTSKSRSRNTARSWPPTRS